MCLNKSAINTILLPYQINELICSAGLFNVKFQITIIRVNKFKIITSVVKERENWLLIMFGLKCLLWVYS